MQVAEDKYIPGTKKLIMTVTSFFIGEVVSSNFETVTLKNACWVGCTGVFKDFLEAGKIDSYDVIPADMEVDVTKQSIVNSMTWPHELPGHETRSKRKK